MVNIQNNSIKRYAPQVNFGLTEGQIRERIRDDLLNKESSLKTKTIPTIIKNNLFTLFNLINFILAIAILYVGSYKNLLFMGVVISNLIIGTYQEIRAKKTVDKLSIVASSKIDTVRNGKIVPVGINDLVLDDVIILRQGNQIPSDCRILKGECEVNESLLTGESDPVHKTNGDMLLSGSFISSGFCYAQVEHIGDQNYAFTISKDAKYIKKVNSEIMKTFNKIILIISVLIIPIGVWLFIKQMENYANLGNAVISTSAALIGMIPEGLVLLTSTVLAVSVVRLARSKVLVQELYCIETLARVDTLCLDKTGTLTEGIMIVNKTVPMGPYSNKDLTEALCFLSSALQDNTATFNAIKQTFNHINHFKLISADVIIPFSSDKKWSGAFKKGYGSFILGAPEFILGEKQTEKLKKQIAAFSKDNRVVAVAKSHNEFKCNQLPTDIELIGFILIKDKIREQAKDTLNYFKEQDVDIKIISGDNVNTVSSIASQMQVKNANKCIDLSKLKTDEEIENAAAKFSIFGRVSPLQKKKLICALKKQGHTVAMTGDGVNDVLALKEADCSIAMASGSAAAKNVSQLILLNSNFDAMPKVVAEGRRSINNIQRSSSLFLVKTIYATLLAIIFLFINMPYPFMPIQMTLTSVLTIGIPSFILALEPNKERIKGRLFINIVTKALPGGLSIVASILFIMVASVFVFLSNSQVSTLCVISSGFIGLLLLFKICNPFNLLRKTLFATMSIGFLVGITLFKDFFAL
ncbi:MAG: HAD-IC family P-type ATPase, partial [Clostridia bacterium]|nr:HAD-IC family P-type ATPase [Clostridia bacterium]